MTRCILVIPIPLASLLLLIQQHYRPISFLDRMEGINHIVLLYDNQKYAYLIIARYFLNGLKKESLASFFTAGEPEAIEESLYAEGIDVNSFKQKTLYMSTALTDLIQITSMYSVLSNV
jgi:hypothetical protein